MRTYKLSPIEELRMEKKRCQEERLISSQRLAYQIQYLNDNWGSMITRGLTSSVKTKLSETIDGLSSNSQTSVTPFVTKRNTTWFNNPIMNLVVNNLPLVGSIVWKIAKPALVAFGTKRITSSIFGGRRRKRK
ncbi:MAG: hypothetical protein ACOYEA_05300 [Fermentimonas sp.]